MNVIQKLADQGRLREAAELCQTHLREEGATATAYYWLGVVHDAAGKLDLASDCYRKAIYLKPDHAEALWQITLLAEKRGQREEARRWRRRAERVEARGRP